MFKAGLRGLVPLLVLLGVVSLAGSARAQYQECNDLEDVPGDVFDTVITTASFSFGDLPGSVCESITAKGVGLCKAQVKSTVKCLKRSVAGTYAIALKQCAQLELAEDRAECKAISKGNKEGLEEEVELIGEGALEVCFGEFAGELADFCTFGVP